MKKVVKKATKKAQKKSTKTSAKKAVKAPSTKLVGFKTVNMKMCSWHDPDFKYEVGKVAKQEIPEDYRNGQSCGVGLHFSPDKAGALSYADDEDYILLKVEADKSNLLGKDYSKYRVSQLKVVSVLETHTPYGASWQAAVKEVKAISKAILVPNKAATPQKLTALASAYGKALGKKAVSVHVITNIYEFLHVWSSRGFDLYSNIEASDRSLDESDITLKSMPIADNGYGCDVFDLQDHVNQLLSSYLGAIEDSTYNDAKENAKAKALFGFLTVGCLPMFVSKNVLFVFAPKENPFTFKSPYSY